MKLVTCLVFVTTLLCSSVANAAVVTVWGEALGGFSLSTINDFYNSLAGHSSSIAGGQLDTVDLSNTDLLWATQPADAYTAAEITAMADFLAAGGRIAYLGEHGGFAPQQNLRINAALTALGANISIVNNALSCGFRTAERLTGEIVDHSLTTGVDLYQYACFAQLNVGAGAEVLMTGDTGSDGAGIAMMAYQNIGPGSIFLITDQNVWDNAGTLWPGFDNEIMFENLLVGRTGAPPVSTAVPEPTSLALLGLGLASAAVARRRKAQKTGRFN